MPGSEFTWSVRSALWQVEHGERGAPRTRDAAVFLERLVSADAETAQTVAMHLLLTLTTREA